MKKHNDYNSVGPILIACELGDKVLKAIKKDNDKVKIKNFGSYFRVLVPEKCILKTETVREEVSKDFNFPEDLELIMPSFKGRLKITPTEACWFFQEESNYE